MFSKKKMNYKDLVDAIKNLGLVQREIEYRPCYVNGRRALFHRWVNTANPVLPRNMNPNDEKARFFQHRSTTGLVEYEDGTLARVWPQEIRFADGGYFAESEWLSVEQLEGTVCQTKTG